MIFLKLFLRPILHGERIQYLTRGAAVRYGDDVFTLPSAAERFANARSDEDPDEVEAEVEADAILAELLSLPQEIKSPHLEPGFVDPGPYLIAVPDEMEDEEIDRHVNAFFSKTFPWFPVTRVMQVRTGMGEVISQSETEITFDATARPGQEKREVSARRGNVIVISPEGATVGFYPQN